MTTRVIIIGYFLVPLLILLVRVSLILFLRHVYVMEYVFWQASLLFILTESPLAGSGREYAESMSHEFGVKQGCYVRIVDGWRLSLVENQYLLPFPICTL